VQNSPKQKIIKKITIKKRKCVKLRKQKSVIKKKVSTTEKGLVLKFPKLSLFISILRAG